MIATLNMYSDFINKEIQNPHTETLDFNLVDFTDNSTDEINKIIELSFIETKNGKVKFLVTDNSIKDKINYNEIFAHLLNFSIICPFRTKMIHYFLTDKFISSKIIIDKNFEFFCGHANDVKLLQKMISRIQDFNVIQRGFDSSLLTNEPFAKIFWKNKNIRNQLNFLNTQLSTIPLSFPFENNILISLNKICDTTPYIQKSLEKAPLLMADCWNNNFQDLTYFNQLILNQKIILTEKMKEELKTDYQYIIDFFDKNSLNIKLKKNLIPLNQLSKKVKI